MTPAAHSLTTLARPRPLGALAPASGQEASGPRPLYLWILIVFLVLEYVRPLVIVQFKVQMLIIVVIPLLWLAARNRPWSSILTAQVLFLVLCLKAVPLAWNGYSAYMVTRTMFGHVSIALGLSWLLADRQSFRKVAWAWLLIIGYASLYGLTHGGTGPGAILGDENDLALGLATALPFALFGFEQLSGWKRWWSAAIGALIVAAIVATYSRGGFLGLVAAVAYYFLASRRKIRNLGMLAALVLALLTLAPESYFKRLGTMVETDAGTAQGRRFLWTAAANMWKANPMLGVGAGNFHHLVGRYQPRDFEGAEFNRRDWTGTTVHSLYFQTLAEQGTPGIVLLAFILWKHLRTLRQLRRRVRSTSGAPPDLRRDVELYGNALAGAVVAYGVAGAFLSVAYHPYLWYFSAMAVALDTAVRRELETLGPAPPSAPAVKPKPATAT